MKPPTTASQWFAHHEAIKAYMAALQDEHRDGVKQIAALEKRQRDIAEERRALSDYQVSPVRICTRDGHILEHCLLRHVKTTVKRIYLVRVDAYITEVKEMPFDRETGEGCAGSYRGDHIHPDDLLALQKVTA